MKKIYKKEKINHDILQNFRDIKKVLMITVLEGNGKDIAYNEIKYIYDLETDKLLGKLN